MVFAAQKLRLQNELHAPTVVIVDDRIDLEDQITGDFTRADIPNIESAKTKDELVAFFKQDQRKILITTIFKFGDVDSVLNERDNIILLVDEAHRTQEKDLGQKMRNALPNAFFFGLTGTPINSKPPVIHVFSATLSISIFVPKNEIYDDTRRSCRNYYVLQGTQSNL